MSDQDCFKRCLNTRLQIKIMSNFCKVSEERMFLWWHRFYRAKTFEDVALDYASTASTLRNHWHELRPKLVQWALQRLVHDGSAGEQYWTTERIHQRTTKMATRMFDPMNEGKTMLNMDSTYLFTFEVHTNHGTRQKMWSKQKEDTIIKVHAMQTMTGDVVHLFVCFSNGVHGDTHIYKALTDEQYILKCEAQPNASTTAL
eukprot:871684_1